MAKRCGSTNLVLQLRSIGFVLFIRALALATRLSHAGIMRHSMQIGIVDRIRESTPARHAGIMSQHMLQGPGVCMHAMSIQCRLACYVA